MANRSIAIGMRFGMFGLDGLTKDGVLNLRFLSKASISIGIACCGVLTFHAQSGARVKKTDGQVRDWISVLRKLRRPVNLRDSPVSNRDAAWTCVLTLQVAGFPRPRPAAIPLNATREPTSFTTLRRA